MNRIINFVKKIKLVQILMAFVAGVFLFATQACANTTDVAGKSFDRNAADIGTTRDHPDPRNYSSKGTPLSPYEGGMNNFSDRDPRAPKELKAATKAKAEYLKDNANRNPYDPNANVGENAGRIIDRYGDVPDVVGKGVQRTGENLQEMTEENAEDFARGTKQGFENIKENIQNAPKALTEKAKVTTENQGINFSKGAEDLSDKAQRAADNTRGYFQNKANQAVNNAQRNLNKAADAIEDAVD
jgi:hypothetical protein